MQSEVEKYVAENLINSIYIFISALFTSFGRFGDGVSFIFGLRDRVVFSLGADNVSALNRGLFIRGDLKPFIYMPTGDTT